ncbi:MAG: aminotransferase class V-fold PLP-dependent enzyme [candidate division KSB1 bacterium]|nr:aminotransferase class V-fold PLP-dependent enzyme [candidate division KSB1 bacterium]
MQLTNVSRREFMKQVAAGSAGILMLEPFLRIRESFAAALASVPRRPESASDFVQLREQYSLAPDVIYFNHGSIGTIPKPVQKAHEQYLRVCESNPWLHMWGGEWEAPREKVRSKAAAVLHCQPDEVAITHNTTEAFNLLAQGLPIGAGDEVLFSSINHPGASICWFHHSQKLGYTVRQFDFPVARAAELTEDELLDLYDRQISPRTRVLVFPYLDNMIGVRHPIHRLARLAKARGVRYVAVDAAQIVGMLPVSVGDSAVDVLATSPHKWLQAPKGLGLLYVRKAVQPDIHPMWVTWGQNRWKGTARIFEDYGTRNMPELLALGDAIAFNLRIAAEKREARLRHLWQFFRQRVTAHPKLEWRSPQHWPISASLYAVEVKGHKSTDVARLLFEKEGFVMRPFATKELNTLRITPNVFSTEEEMERFFVAIERYF